MAKTVIGIDVGLHSLKAVSISGSAKMATLCRVAMVPQTAMAESIQQSSEKAVASQLKDLVDQLKSGCNVCHFAFNSPSAVLRYVEAPYYPQADMRASLKFNHQTYLRQNFENYTFDGICLFPEPEKLKKDARDKRTDVEKPLKKGKTLIAGLPNAEVLIFYLAAKRAGLKPASLSLTPLSLINGFELAYPQSFHNDSVLLLDIGHLSSSLTIIHHGSVFLTRVVPLGGKNVLDYLAQSQGSPQQAETAKLEGGEALGAAVQAGLAPLTRDVHSSVNFFERNADTDLGKIYLSGMLVKAPIVAEMIQKETGFPCDVWNPAEGMKITLPAGQKQMYLENQSAFAASIGIARAMLE